MTPHKIIKTRYEIKLGGGDWVVDCFEQENHPLILAEVELPTVKSAFKQPHWCWKEVTGENTWSNASLAQNPISTWPLEKRILNHIQTGP